MVASFLNKHMTVGEYFTDKSSGIMYAHATVPNNVYQGIVKILQERGTNKTSSYLEKHLLKASLRKLLGTSPNLQSAVKLISEFFGGATITLTEVEPGTWSVSNSQGPLPRFQVTLAKGRYRFEAIQ
jgi:hypothetical protein